MKITVEVSDYFLDELEETFPKIVKELGGNEQLGEYVAQDVIDRYCNWEYVNEYTIEV